MTTTKDRGPRAGTATETPTKTKRSEFVPLSHPLGPIPFVCHCGFRCTVPDNGDGNDWAAVRQHHIEHRVRPR